MLPSLSFFDGILFVNLPGENAFLAPSGNHWSATQTNLTASSSAIKAHIIELEGPSYSFKSVFQQPGAIKVRFKVIKTLLPYFSFSLDNKLKQWSLHSRGRSDPLTY